MNKFAFSINIHPDSWIEYYRSPKSTVVATAFDGRRIQFAAKHLKKHVTRDGITGIFVLTIDANNDFVSLERER